MCPSCGAPMIAFEFQGVEVDECVDCGGTWLDAGELELLVELTGQSPGRLTKAVEDASVERRGKRRCPRCRRRMPEIAVQGKETIELDRCPRGDGLWFDRHELLTLIRSFHEGEAGAVARHYAELFRSDLIEDKP